MVVADMPFMSYQVDSAQALLSAGRLIQQGGAQAVKLEGGKKVAGSVERIVDAGIPVMGHIGLTPQSVHQLGGFKMQGKTHEAAATLVEDALALERAGAFAVVLEVIPDELARQVTQALSIPTIGIGAGPFCDGQIQVINDILGMDTNYTPKHAKVYAPLGDAIRDAASRYRADVEASAFPQARTRATA
jgi:3-methyl-2-oxobutanoate hydroxymethyltransferase